MTKLIRGIAPAICTPFDQDGELALGSVPPLVHHFLEANAAGFFACGATGEGKFMTVPERKQMAEAVVRETGGTVPVIVHVGATATENGVELARHAASIGADATASMAPLEAPGDLGAAVAHYSAIGAATDRPFYVYWTAALAGSTVTAEQFLEEMGSVANFAGIKFTDTNFYLFQQLVDRSGGSINAVTGPDEMCLAGLVMGSDGAIGGTFNVMPRLFSSLYEAFQTRDMERAMALQVRANRVISQLLCTGVWGGLKAILGWRGIPVGKPRDPEVQLSPEGLEELKRFVESLDFEIA